VLSDGAVLVVGGTEHTAAAVGPTHDHSSRTLNYLQNVVAVHSVKEVTAIRGVADLRFGGCVLVFRAADREMDQGALWRWATKEA
jgi:hypothetical protein